MITNMQEVPVENQSSSQEINDKKQKVSAQVNEPAQVQMKDR
jgi:hypothetical protein